MTTNIAPALITLTTPRLTLRQWCAADRAPFAALNADPLVMKYFPATLDRAASDAVADRIEAGIAARGFGFWATEITATREFIGFVGISVPMAPFPHLPCVDVGWRLARAFWHQGYATEAANAALDVGFGQIGLDEIIAFTALTNTPSRAVMVRLGMREDAATFMHPRVPEASPVREHCLYRLTKAAWLTQPARGAAK